MENRLDGKRGKGLYRRREDYASLRRQLNRFEITVLNACKTSGAETSGGEGIWWGDIRHSASGCSGTRGGNRAGRDYRPAGEGDKAGNQPGDKSLTGSSHGRQIRPISMMLIIRYGEDEVRSYFGMRKLSTGRDRKGILRFFLNNKPYFLTGFWIRATGRKA